MGFTIVDKEPEKQEHDFARVLRDYLKNIYQSHCKKVVEASGAIINVRGWKYLKTIGVSIICKKTSIIDGNNPDRYFAVVFGVPEKTFVFSKEAIVAFFNRYPSISREGERPSGILIFAKTMGTIT